MAGDVDDVVGTGHHVNVSVLVDVAGVGGFVVAGKVGEVGVHVTLVRVPQGGQGAGRQGQLAADGPDVARLHRLVVVVQHTDVPAGHGLGRRPGLHRIGMQAQAVGGHGPAGFGLPPVIDDRTLQVSPRPFQGIGVGALAGQEQGREVGQVVGLQQLGVGVLALDGAKRRRRGEQDLDLVLGNDAPEGAGVGGPHRLAFVKDGGAAVEQRRVHDVGMADHPAHVRGRPVHVAGVHVVDVLHGPFERHQVPAVVAHGTLGLTGGARRIQDVQGVGGGHGHPVVGLGPGHQVVPVHVAPGDHLRLGLGPLHDDAFFRLVPRQLDGPVEQRLVFDDAVDLDAAGRRNDRLRLGVVDARRQFVAGEPAEDDRMHGADAGARQHGDHRLGHHGHIDDDPVALADSQAGEAAGEPGDDIAEFPVGIGPDRVAGDRAVVDEGRLIGPAAVHVTVERVVARVEDSAREPAVERRIGVVEDLVPLLHPVDVLGHLAPEAVGVAEGSGMGLFVAVGHGLLPFCPGPAGSFPRPGQPAPTVPSPAIVRQNGIFCKAALWHSVPRPPAPATQERTNQETGSLVLTCTISRIIRRSCEVSG